MSVQLEPILAVFLAPFIGSFLGMLAHRIPAGQAWGWSRSRCSHCRTQLDAIELVPVLSYIFLKGRCRHCGREIPVDFLLVELGALVVALWSYSALPSDQVWIACLLGWQLLLLSAIDVRHHILPDTLTLLLLLFGLLLSMIFFPMQLGSLIAAAVIGFAALYLVLNVYRVYRGRSGLGLGDVKLFAAGGVWVGAHGLLSVLTVSATSALLGVLVATLCGFTKVDQDSAIPFGPYLSLGIWITWLHGPLALF